MDMTQTVHRKLSKDDRQQITRQEAQTVEWSGQAGTKRARSRERVAEFFTHVQTPESRAEKIGTGDPSSGPV
jgi:hypothetical protein